MVSWWLTAWVMALPKHIPFWLTSYNNNNNNNNNNKHAIWRPVGAPTRVACVAHQTVTGAIMVSNKSCSKKRQYRVRFANTFSANTEVVGTIIQKGPLFCPSTREPLKRVCLCSSALSLLPPWASRVKAVVHQVRRCALLRRTPMLLNWYIYICMLCYVMLIMSWESPQQRNELGGETLITYTLYQWTIVSVRRSNAQRRTWWTTAFRIREVQV
jgi:hypothetical protein